MGPAQGSAFEARRRQRSITALPSSRETPAAVAAAQNAPDFGLFVLTWPPGGLGSRAILVYGKISVFGNPVLCEGTGRVRVDEGGVVVPQRARTALRRIPLRIGRRWRVFSFSFEVWREAPRLTRLPSSPPLVALTGLQM